MNRDDAMSRIIECLDEAAVLASKHFSDTDIYNYGRAYEYLMAASLGHVICETRYGPDGYTANGEDVEYKTTSFKGYKSNGAMKQHSFHYFGFSRFDNWEEQVQYATDKILANEAHYWGVKNENGFGMKKIYRVESKEVLRAFMEKLPSKWNKVAKDPRINIGISLGDVEYEQVFGE